MHEQDRVNILMVDDQPAKLLSYEAILSELGENLIKAGSGREALEHLLKTDIALVLMDVSMPELDGFELAQIIRQHPRYQKTAIIFISAVHLTDLDRLKGYEHGAVDYIAVPVIPQILRAKVCVFAELYRKTHQLERLNCELEQRVAERTEELQNRAEALQRLNVELEHSNRELDAFAYIASHDLKEPLRGIHNFAHFLHDSAVAKLDDVEQGRLQTIIRLTQRMDDLIESLLLYSRVGRVELTLHSIPLQEVLNQTLEGLRTRIEQSRVEVRIPRPLPVINCDRVRVAEVFYNLLANAIKYNDKARRWVEIGHEDAEPSVFYVRDNGIGIAPENCERIFEIFRRLHGSDEFGGGTGVGLTITKKTIERHGGCIWVDSTPGDGTTFYFTLAPAQGKRE
jgi:signal transduction histidine kinase